MGKRFNRTKISQALEDTRVRVGWSWGTQVYWIRRLVSGPSIKKCFSGGNGSIAAVWAGDIDVTHFATGTGFGFTIPVESGVGVVVEELGARNCEPFRITNLPLPRSLPVGEGGGNIDPQDVNHAGFLTLRSSASEVGCEAGVLVKLRDTAPIEGVVSGVVGAGGDFVDEEFAGIEFEQFNAEKSVAVDGFDGGDCGFGCIGSTWKDLIADVVDLNGLHGGEASRLGF